MLHLLAAADIGLVLLLVLIGAFIALGSALANLRRRERLEQTVLDWAGRNGVRILSRERRRFARGPFFWTASNRDVVYRIVVEFQNRRVAHGWMRCRASLFGLLAGNAEVLWDRAKPAQPGFPVIVASDESEQTMAEPEHPITIARAAEADVTLMLDLIRELADYEKLSHEVVATAALLREHLFGPRPVAEAFIARVGGQPAGFALFFHNFSTFLAKPGIYLEDLFVKPEFRARGVGKALLRAVARVAVERDCGRLEWSVLDWNEPALGFYKRLGAVPMSEWTVHRVTGDALRELAD